MNAIVEGTLTLRTPEVFLPALSGAPYVYLWGGRGSGKSHFVAEALIEDSLAEPGENGGAGMLTVCMREIQKDLKQSSKRLVEAKLASMQLGERDGFKKYADCIKTPGDGLMIFKGMNDYTAESIKSLEGFKRSWWEEAQNATATSMNLFNPTLREAGSKRFYSWNPTRKAAAIESFGRGPLRQTGAVTIRANWRDNPFFPGELERERLDCLRTQPEMYDHIWEGGYVRMLEGAYYAASLALAKLQGRIGFVGLDPLLTRHAFADIGGTGARADAFTFWIWQFVGREIRVLDYYEAVGQPASTHLEWLRGRGYTIKNTQIWLPHDGEKQDSVHDASYAGFFGKGGTGAGYNVEVVPNQGKGAAKSRIEAGRRHFPSMRFNSPEVIIDPETTPTCAGGLEAIGWYHEKKDEHRNIGLGPDHDWSSHGADSFGLGAVCADRIFAEQGRTNVSEEAYGSGWR
ncbi:MAG: phage terminase large subunit [Steroidobacteraceae bacterium]